MTRTKVTSETLKSVGYEPDSERLELEFSGGDVYEYEKVQPYLYMGLMDTSAKESYFEKYIKDKYKFAKVKITNANQLEVMS